MRRNLSDRPARRRGRIDRRGFAIATLLEQLTLNALNANILVAQTLATTHLHNDPLRRQEIATRARYCQMLAGRYKLGPAQTARLVLSAWVSLFDANKDLTAFLRSQHRLDEILFPPDGAPPLIEAQILGLIKCYQEGTHTLPGSGRDLAAMRAFLEKTWATSPDRQDMLRRFLRLLADEQFLAAFGRSAGRILIVHTDEPTTGLLSLPLRGEGYYVEAVRDTSAADQSMAQAAPDLIIAEANLPVVEGLQTDGIAFCQRLKATPETAKIPLLLLVPKGRSAAKKGMRAGADDVLTEPVDLELLSHKIKRLIAARPAPEPGKAGVTGTLVDMNFTDMIQVFSAGGQNMRIDIVRGDQQAAIYIQNGEIVHAVNGAMEGEPAFFEIMKWREGTFSAAHCEAFPPRTIRSSTMSLLMEGARLLDESAST